MIEDLKKYNNLFDNEERKQLIANSLIDLRKQFNYSQEKVANLIGVKKPTYATYETGRNEPKIEVLVRLSILYSIPIDIIVQKDAMSKNKLDEISQAEQYENAVKELKKQLSNNDPNANESLRALIDQIKDLTQAIKDTSDNK